MKARSSPGPLHDFIFKLIVRELIYTSTRDGFPQGLERLPRRFQHQEMAQFDFKSAQSCPAEQLVDRRYLAEQLYGGGLESCRVRFHEGISKSG